VKHREELIDLWRNLPMNSKLAVARRTTELGLPIYLYELN
jgi:hypothetical protein